MHMTWKRIASVTTGGKRHFYTRYLSDGRQISVVWDRQVLAYRAAVEDMRQGPHGRTVDYCSTALQARRSIDRAVSDGRV